uniref:Uncharacterized protein n=1 Tax=Panagrolaimus sp. JU765 TaxID=591449 RepID=A0AC34QPK1_9BILA
MEHCDNDWLQITENTDATCNFDLMSRKRKGYRIGSQLQLILSKVVGEDLVRHVVSKAESLQEKFEEGQERINLLSDELKEKDKVIKQQAVENSTLNENVTTLNEEITTLNKKVAELDNNLEAERDANQQLADELGDNIHIIEELKSENADYRQIIAELRKENLTLDEEVDANIKLKKKAEAERDEMEEKLEILEEKYRILDIKYNKLYPVAKRREEDVVILKEEMFDETSKVKDLVALCDKLKNDNMKYEKLVRKLKSTISQLDARIKIEELKKK